VIYGERTNGSHHGTVYTNREVVDFITDLCLADSALLAGKVIIEPSAGDGAFIVPLLERIVEECSTDINKLRNALANIHIYELDGGIIPALKDNIRAILHEPGLVSLVNIYVGDFLLADIPQADIVVGNPPYVRYDNIPLDQKEKYKALFPSFSARCDLYVPFIEKSIKALKPNGKLGFICADRWINNQYGRMLRGIISRNFHLKYFIKFSGYNPFQEDVIAYPSVFLIENTGQDPNIIFSEVSSAKDLSTPNLLLKSKRFHFGENAEVEYDDLKARFLSLEEQGFKIGIGVATGADKVFITSSPDAVESDLLVPLVSRRDFVGNAINWRGYYLINTYSHHGSGLVDLNNYPRLKAHLDAHITEVKARHVAKKNGTSWYKLIDPVNRDLLAKPKLLIPDITTKKSIIFDSGNYYPHHNLYYITATDERKLLVLRSILVSDFCTRQVAQKGVLMNGGALRWQAQTLRKLFLPDIDQIPPEVSDKLIELYERDDFASINKVVADIESLSPSVAKETVSRRIAVQHSVQPDSAMSWFLPQSGKNHAIDASQVN
jgi:adenine-specific DNA-methyltransferase